MTVETDLSKVVALLEEKGRATRLELGTDAATMKTLESAGLVVRDGVISTGKKGKPPIAYVVAKGRSAEDASAISVVPKRTRSGNPDESIQNRLERALVAVKNSPYAEGCDCVCTWEGISYELVRHHPGCKDRWICGALVSLREKAGLNKL